MTPERSAKQIKKNIMTKNNRQQYFKEFKELDEQMKGLSPKINKDIKKMIKEEGY